MQIFAADHPLVVNGTYDTEGYKPGEHARIAKVKARAAHFDKDNTMAKRVSRKPQPAAKPAPTRGPRPARTQPLPGLEDVRIQALDDVASSIAEIREQMNTLRTDEAGYLKNALTLMRKHDRQTWRASGVELVRVAGEEKLRVRTTKEKATAEVEAEADGEEHVDVRETGDELRPGVPAEH